MKNVLTRGFVYLILLLCLNLIFSLIRDRVIACFASDLQPAPFTQVSQKTEQAFPSSTNTAVKKPGYLLFFELKNGECSLSSVAAINNYVANKHLGSSDDWSAVLMDDRDQFLWKKRIDNPGYFSPILSAEQVIPFTVKIPHLPRLANVVLYDQRQREIIRVSVDDSFKADATASREKFLQFDKRNRELLQERVRQDREKPQSASFLHNPRTLRYRDLPKPLQQHLTSEIAREMEMLVEYGPGVMNLRRGHSIDPRVLRNQLRASQDLTQRMQQVRSNTLEVGTGAYTLSGHVTDADTGAPLSGVLLSFYQYDASWNVMRYMGDCTTDDKGFYSIPCDSGNVRCFPSYLGVGTYFFSEWYDISISGDATFNIEAIPGITLSGVVTDTNNNALSGVCIFFFDQNENYSWGVTTYSSGTYFTVTPKNRPITISLYPLSPYATPTPETDLIFTDDTIKNFQVERGVVISGTVTDDSGAVIPARLLLRQLNGMTTNTPYWYISTDVNGRYNFVVSKNLLPNSFLIAVYNESYVQQTIDIQLTEDTIQNFSLQKGITVSGYVHSGTGEGVGGARVRVYEGETFITSALTSYDGLGLYTLTLSPGTYTFKVSPDVNNLGNYAPTEMANIQVTGNLIQNFILEIASAILTINVYFTDLQAAGLTSRCRIESVQSGKVISANWTYGSVQYDYVKGKYFQAFSSYPDNGIYDIIIHLVGYAPQTIPNLSVAGSVTVDLVLSHPFLWKGVLRDQRGTPLPFMSISSYDGIADQCEWYSTDENGNFTIPITPGGFVQFNTNEGSQNIPYKERLGEITGDRNSDCIMDEFPSFLDTGSVLTQMYGVADRTSRYNIVFLGDSYTDITETYTDLNYNGQWDGVLFYDLNGNGVWDSGEPDQLYGNAMYPVAGTDPTTNNEPFTDTNGDAVPNLHDQVLYDRNSLDTIRSLFGQDFWNSHRDAFNVFRIRVISNQAGHDILDENGNVVISRNTALGTYLDSPDRGYLFEADRDLVMQYINEYVPECDTKIVLVNQPIFMGRVTAFIFAYGGELTGLCNSCTIAHEMGHKYGLSDEYTEFLGPYYVIEDNWENVTTLTDPEQIPWKSLITPGKEIPSIPYSSGVGLFEGARYYTDGVYRPTQNCMMVGGNRYCPVCTQELEYRLMSITKGFIEPVLYAPSGTISTLRPTFSWEEQAGVSHYLLEIERLDNNQLVASFDIYDVTFQLPFDLSPGVSYQWRLQPGVENEWGNWSEWLTFTTPASKPSVATSDTSDVTLTSATLNGTVNPNGENTEAWFEYGITTAYGGVTPSENVGNGTSDVAISSVLSNLLRSTTYHFRAVAQNAYGITYGEDKYFTTTIECSTWENVITKYQAYVNEQATWDDVIDCYQQYAAGGG
ncbi:MAG: M64 family metallo-endopeptidase [Proteobacteria bacterium]|nr:M64 family metallo-endopeptidase [Pseudomonadota bacterium]